MWFITILFGAVLIALGPVGYAISDKPSPTAFIPSAFGVVLVVCGVLARKDQLRKHVMHVAVLIGLIGFVVPAIRVAMKLPEVSDSFFAHKALVMQTIMAAVCLLFVVLCVNSFIQARILRRKVGLPDPKALP